MTGQNSKLDTNETMVRTSDMTVETFMQSASSADRVRVRKTRLHG
jgi:hypothetical protein